MFTVAVYEGGLAFGGPEEGGWWYWAGEIVPDTAHQVPTEEAAYELMRELRDRFPEGSDRTSVIPRERDFNVYMFDGTIAPEYVPERRPHYE